MKSMIHKHKDKDFIECDYCGELFVKGEPFCPCCGKPAEEILREEGAKEDINLVPALHDYYTRHMADGTFERKEKWIVKKYVLI